MTAEQADKLYVLATYTNLFDYAKLLERLGKGGENSMRIKVCHLYPDLLNLYGDRGNVLIFCRRAEWRGIEVQLDLISLGDQVRFTDYDFIFTGGGADLDQGLVSKDLEKKGPLLISAVEQGVALLCICGSYQLLGRYYRSQNGSVLTGVGLFDHYTEAGSRRLEGNILLDFAPQLQDKAGSVPANR